MEIHGYQLTFDAVDHLIKADMSIDKTGGKGTRKGRPNYKSSILLKVVRSILPASKLGWEEVADDYKLSTKEENLRTTPTITKQQQQSNNQMMQMMMMMQARGAQPSHLTYNNALGRNEENYDDDGRYGTPLDSCH